MGIPTLIATNTEDDDATSSFTSGITSAYDEYMFVMTDIGPANDGVEFLFQVSTDSGSNYNVTVTSSYFSAYYDEAGSEYGTAHRTGDDQAQGTAFHRLGADIGNGADESTAGILHLFNPASTTYVKHWYYRGIVYRQNNGVRTPFVSGYFNTTSAVDAIQFKMSAGNMDGVIQMYGIS